MSALKDGERKTINWTELPQPQYVVHRVMQDFRKFERHVAMLPGGLEMQSYEWDIERTAKLCFIARVTKEVSRLLHPGDRVVMLMHPPENQDVAIGDIMNDTGLSQTRINRIYDRCVKILAVKFINGGLFFESEGEVM
jgi:hypothetical protein